MSTGSAPVGSEYTVVGIFAQAKGGFFGENGLDRQVAIPFQTARVRYPQSENFFLTAKARTGFREDAIEDLCDAGLIVPAGADVPGAPYLFTHRTVQEYLVARTLAQEMSKDLGVSVIIENRPGAGTIIGTQSG